MGAFRRRASTRSSAGSPTLPPTTASRRFGRLPAPDRGERHVICRGAARALCPPNVPRTLLRTIGSTKRDLTFANLARLFQQRGRDEQAVLAATVDHLNPHRLEAFVGRSPTNPWLDLLRNTRVAVPTSTASTALPSGSNRSGVLPRRAPGFRRTPSLRAARRPGVRPDRTPPATSSRSSCSPRQTRRRSAAASRDTLSMSSTRPIVNAVAHRDYAISGSKPASSCWPTAWSSTARGKPPNTITLDDIPYRTFPRNQLLGELPLPPPQQAYRGRCSWIAGRRRTEDHRGSAPAQPSGPDAVARRPPGASRGCAPRRPPRRRGDELQRCGEARTSG